MPKYEKVKVVGKFNEGSELDLKRCYVPGVTLTSTCPKCKEVVTRDLSKDYFSYPVVGAPMVTRFYHEDETGDGHAWTVSVVLDITVRAAKKGE